MSYAYRAFLEKKIDLSPLNLSTREENTIYPCTPKGAKIIGWAGLNMIHYCFAWGFGDMVFSVSPMNHAPYYVHPLARNFLDFLRLLLTCPDCTALDLAWQWKEDKFNEYLKRNPPNQEQAALHKQIAEEMKLTPMERPWKYMHDLQASFDYRKLRHTEESYDLSYILPSAKKEGSWAVYFGGGFRNQALHGSQFCKELPISAQFEWAGRQWLLPAVHTGARGLVIDLCMEIDPIALQGFMEKWNIAANPQLRRYLSPAEQMQMDLDNPFFLNYSPGIQVNRKTLKNYCCHQLVHNPLLKDRDASFLVEHYGLDPSLGWMIERHCFTWVTKDAPKINSLILIMNAKYEAIPGPCVLFQKAGDSVCLMDPIMGSKYSLTAEQYLPQCMDFSPLSCDGTSYPCHYIELGLRIQPEVDQSILSFYDCAEADLPNRPQKNRFLSAKASDIIQLENRTLPKPSQEKALCSAKSRGLRTIYSSLRFEAQAQVKLQSVFYQKQYQDLMIVVLSK